MKIMDAIRKHYFHVESDDSESEEPLETPSKKKKDDSAWHEEDDTMIVENSAGIHIAGTRDQAPKTTRRYQNRLEEPLDLVNSPIPNWAPTFCDSDAGKDNDLDEAVKRNLPPNKLQFQYCVPLNIDTKDEGKIIRSIKFNPVNDVALVAGDSVVNMIRVSSGLSHPLLQKIAFRDFQLKDVVWSNSSTDFYVTSRNGSNWFFHFNIAAMKSAIVKPNALTSDDEVWKLIPDPLRRYLIALGNGGRIHVLSETTKEVVDTFRMNSTVSDATFSSDGRMLYTFGEDGELNVWDMNTRERMTAWYDDSTGPRLPSGHQILTRCSEYTAFASETGIVNVYSNSDLQDASEHKKRNTKQKLPQPRKEYKKIKTGVTSLTMNSHSEILAIASHYEDGALRLLHLPSMTTFNNFEPGGQIVGSVHCVDFSPGSGYLSFGNNRGKAFLFRLKHYSSY